MHYLTSVNSGHLHTLCVYPSMKCVNASFLIPLTFKVCLRFSLIMGPYHDVSVVSSTQQFPVRKWFFWSTLLIQPCCCKHFVMALPVSNALPDTFCSKHFDTYFYMHNSKALIILLKKPYQYLALSFSFKGTWHHKSEPNVFSACYIPPLTLPTCVSVLATSFLIKSMQYSRTE